ncbi:MAG: hypothetical protein LBP83_00565 [Dysgonamonadaceae bacterium]|nr:hypothetical protein [Dysgonamonadaceae bacterium]
MKLPITIILFLCSLEVLGQSSLGKIHLIHNSSLGKEACSLYERATRNNYTSHSGSFQAIAFPADRLDEKTVTIDYVNNEFVVRIGDRELYPDLPDWQLVPIVHFANSSYQGIFTASGDTKNGDAQLKYHPAFLNTLLGLRLFQAHLLIIIPETLGEIPRDENGNYILAGSEEGLMPPTNLQAYKAIFNELKQNNININSYILTDKELNLFFDIDGDDVSFSDNPYYYFFKNEIDMVKIKKMRKEVESYYSDIENIAKNYLKDKYSSELNPRTNLKGLLKALGDNKQNEVFDPYSLYYIEGILDKLADLNQLTDEELGLKFQVMDNLSSSFKRNWRLLKQYNPLVYSAVENTSHWAAFFRYIRLTNPDNWNLFLKKIETIKIEDTPVVKTPTSFVKN